MEFSFILNGKRVVCDISDNQTLLDLLRDSLGVTSVKKGCEQGECGACTVLLDGEPVTSCLVLARRIEGREVTTVEGLVDDPKMKSLREAFLEEGAVQCGYCTPGMLLSAYSLIRSNLDPTEAQVKKAIEGNLCRCTGYVKIIEAIIHAAKKLKSE
ncbi:(2Fe-2S)-binding protein [Candidatus Bathyarchaeota archaeon]|nr:(2Fe-2S)-binding protein [Candidatus Bathyarchaeota archaeon]